MAFAVGQRWLSLTESELGLGVVQKTDHRTVTIHFPLAEQTRVFAQQGAPLTRAVFQIGDTLPLMTGEEVQVLDVKTQGDVVYYLVQASNGEQATVSEATIGGSAGRIGPMERLQAGEMGDLRWFEMRRRLLAGMTRHKSSLAFGFAGPKLDIIPHQMDVAAQVLRMPQPRALLADEVGLGKTIEAGLVLHQMLVSGRAARALICVPPALVNQWLVELKRKFNLNCTVIDNEYCEALQGQNPFNQSQLALCDFKWLVNSRYFPLAVKTQWDLLIVDEAHQLEWLSPAYKAALELSNVSTGVLLLTATPEQLGLESHFARLHLLDPDRFPSLEKFITDEQRYSIVSEMVDLLEGGDLSGALELARELNDDKLLETIAQSEQSIESLIDWLVDRYGTGRMVFRNTRKVIKGFPERHTHFYTLSQKKTDWLTQWLEQQGDNKILLICHSQEAAEALCAMVNAESSVQAGAFHQGLDIIDRDRIAASFVEPDGIQLLICSEIGGEGRNFQHAQHLVIFDMPPHPDYLEQRIGRLDRIGQLSDIHLHIPVMENTPEARMARIYDEGFNIFNKPNAAAAPVFEHMNEEIMDAVKTGEALDIVVERVFALTEAYSIEIEQGRDKLLEKHSFEPNRVEPLLNAIAVNDSLSNELNRYFEDIFDLANVDFERQSNGNLVIEPSENATLTFVKQSEDEAQTVTFSRRQASLREDINFITWDHPWVGACLDDLDAGGKTHICCALIQDERFRQGQVLVESFFSVASKGPGRLQLHRHLNPLLIHRISDEKGTDFSSLLDVESLRRAAKGLDAETGLELVRMKWAEIQKMLKTNEQRAHDDTQQHIQAGIKNMLASATAEIKRYKSLEQVPGQFKQEIDIITANAKESHGFMSRTRVELQGICIWVNY